MRTEAIVRTRDDFLARHTPAIHGRIASLDGLRGISILLVLLGHTALSDGAPQRLAVFSHVGNIGVRVFFIISGLLITTLLLKEWTKTGTISIRQFYLRRVFRIFPAAYLLIGVIALLGAMGRVSLRPHEAFYASVFLMNYHDFRALHLGQLWSLSVEEQFYLLWPGLLLLAGIRRGLRCAWAVVFLAPILRACIFYGWHASDTAMTKHFETVADSLAMGCLIALQYNQLSASERYRRLQARPVIFFGLALGLILLGNALFVVNRGIFYVFGQTLANIGTALCIDWGIRNPDRPIGRFLNWKPLVFVGMLSYSLYLWQNPFLLGDSGTFWTTYPTNLAFALIASLLSYFVVEKPFLVLKDHLSKTATRSIELKPELQRPETEPARSTRA